MTTARTTARTAAAFVADDLSWDAFVRDIPDRGVRRVVEQRDAIEDEAASCQRTQSWSPRSIRSGWAPELSAVVDAIDALREAHDAVSEAEDEDEHEALVLARCEAFEALEDAIEAAEHEAFVLAARVAEAEAEEALDALLDAANDAADDAEWEEALREHLDRHNDGDRGWNVTRAEDGVLTITGWAMRRHVMGDDCGGIVLGTDVDVVEAELRGRVAFQVTRDEDGSDEPNGLCPSVAIAVRAAMCLAESFGIDGGDWSDAWDVKPRWVEPDAVRVLSPAELLGLREVYGYRYEFLQALPQEDLAADDLAWGLAGDPDEDLVCRVTATTEGVCHAGAIIVYPRAGGVARLFVPVVF